MSIGVHFRVPRVADDANPLREFLIAIRVGGTRAAEHSTTLCVGSPSKKWLLAHRISATVAIATLCMSPAETSAAPLNKHDFAELASQCAPTVPAPLLEAVARTESGLDSWALHDNTSGTSEQPESKAQAISDALRWIDRGDSVDIGLMQIKSSNLPALDMTLNLALDPCVSLKGGAAILRAAYGGGTTSAENQAALLIALSRYNTGSPFRGIINGYAREVMMNAGNGAIPALFSAVTTTPLTDSSAPPSWDVSATGTYAQEHGASWIIPLFPVVGSRSPRAGPSASNPSPNITASK